MGTRTIWHLDDRMIARLKAHALENGRSLECEIRRQLTEPSARRLLVARFRERTRDLGSATAGTPQSDSAILPREDRDR